MLICNTSNPVGRHIEGGITFLLITMSDMHLYEYHYLLLTAILLFFIRTYSIVLILLWKCLMHWLYRTINEKQEFWHLIFSNYLYNYLRIFNHNSYRYNSNFYMPLLWNIEKPNPIAMMLSIFVYMSNDNSAIERCISSIKGYSSTSLLKYN